MRGQRLGDRVRIARMLAHLHLRHGRLRRLTDWLPRRQREFDLKLRAGPDLRLRTEDVVAIFILGAGEYDVDYSPLGELGTLLDLGANVGIASIYLADRLSPTRVVCVEPSPENHRLLAVNLRRNLPQATAMRAAVMPRPGRFRMEAAEEPGELRVVDERGEVEGLTLEQIIDRAGLDTVDLLKVDIEGGELALFERAGEWAGRVGAILAEVHPPLSRATALAMLEPHGFAPLPIPERPLLADLVFARREG
jgi:FkbM family methyltransferase